MFKKRKEKIKNLTQEIECLKKKVKEFSENPNLVKTPPKFGAVSGIIDENHLTTELNENLGIGQDKVDKVLEMERIDPKLKGLMNTRVLSLTGLKREIIGDDEVADFVRWVFSRFSNFSKTLREILNDSLKLGSAYPELIWGESDGKIIIQRVEVRSPGKFKFGGKNQLLFITEDKDIPVDERRIVPLTYNGIHGNRYGNGIYNEIYWNNFIKKHVKEFWAIGIEKYNVPIVIAKDPGMEAETRASIDKFVTNIKHATGITIPEGVTIDFLEAKRKMGDSEENFLNYLDSENAISVLGQTLTSNISDVGSFAAAKIHDLIRKDILVSDINMVESYINDLWIKPLVDLNFPKVEKYPKWRIVQKDTIDQTVMIQVIEGLLRSGFKTIPVNWVHQVFGIPQPGEGEETLSLSGSLDQPSEEQIQDSKNDPIKYTEYFPNE